MVPRGLQYDFALLLFEIETLESLSTKVVSTKLAVLQSYEATNHVTTTTHVSVSMPSSITTFVLLLLRFPMIITFSVSGAALRRGTPELVFGRWKELSISSARCRCRPRSHPRHESFQHSVLFTSLKYFKIEITMI